PPRRGGEVVEDVLLVLAHAGPVPGLALLAAAAQVGDRVDAAALDPGEDGGAVLGGEGDVEAAVAVQDGRPGAVGGQALVVQDEHAHLGAVVGAERLLAGDHPLGLDPAGRVHPQRERAAADHVAVDAWRGGEVGPADPDLVAAFRAGRDAAYRAQAGQLHPAPEAAVDEVVHPDPADRVAGLGDQQRVAGDGEVLDHRLALRDQVAPAGRLGPGRVGDHDAEAGGVQVGAQVQA